MTPNTDDINENSFTNKKRVKIIDPLQEADSQRSLKNSCLNDGSLLSSNIRIIDNEDNMLASSQESIRLSEIKNSIFKNKKYSHIEARLKEWDPSKHIHIYM